MTTSSSELSVSATVGSKFAFRDRAFEVRLCPAAAH